MATNVKKCQIINEMEIIKINYLFKNKIICVFTNSNLCFIIRQHREKLEIP